MKKFIKTTIIEYLNEQNNILLAPNGKVSNLTPIQYKIVITIEFKKWFGDWENDLNNSSKVIDNNGEPLICYHGSNQKFNVFNREKISYNNLSDVAQLGFWFTTQLWEAEGFAYGFDEKQRSELDMNNGIIYTTFLNIRNPLNIENVGYKLDEVYNTEKHVAGMYIEKYQLKIKNIFESGNYDGITLDNIWLPQYSNQIKLADGKNITFNIKSEDIRF